MQVPQQIDMDVSVFLEGGGVKVAGGKGAAAKKVAGMCTKCCKRCCKKRASRAKQTRGQSEGEDDDGDDLCTVS
jgi:hypothetical protein